jgi:PleD family two-component response regulator
MVSGLSEQFNEAAESQPSISISESLNEEEKEEKHNTHDLMSLDNCKCQPKVLVVDDNNFNIMAITSIIKENFKIEVHEANNGEKAVEMYKKAVSKKCKCRDRVYRVIFMDIQMPVLDGIQATIQIIEFIKKNQSTLPYFKLE